ncbi:MAG: hypothetical protein AAF726_22160 [Planctomycetota bacterium]
MTTIALLLASLALPQAGTSNPTAASLPALRPPDRVVVDDPGDGSHWAVGHRYKAGIDERGFEIIAFLGSDADGSVRARFTVDSVTVGGTPVELGERRPRRVEHALIVDRGAVVERYECGLDAVEQFVEVQLEGLAGELCVHVRVETPLARPLEGTAPLRFGRGEVSIRVGEAFVVDQAGERVAVASTRTEHGYAIVVPSEIVAEAGESIVIDPVISSGFLTSDPQLVETAVDVASIGSVGFLLAVERRFNTTDNDVYVYRVDPNVIAPAVFIAAIDASSTDVRQPAIAGSEVGDEVMVVYWRNAFGGGIFARRTNATGSSVGTPFLISDTVTSFLPDVGALTNGSFLLPRYCAVWVRIANPGQPRTVACVFTRNGRLSPLTAAGDWSGDEFYPAVSTGSGAPSSSAPQLFHIAYTSTEPNGRTQIEAAAFNADGDRVIDGFEVAVVDDPTRVGIASTNATRLADGSAPYVVVWDSDAGPSNRVWAATCVGGAVRGAPVELGAASQVEAGLARRRPSVAAAEDHWIIAYDQRVPNGDYNVHVCTGGATPSGFGLAERAQWVLPSSETQERPAVATLYEGGRSGFAGSRGLIAWRRNVIGGLTEGALVEPIPDEVAGVQYCESNLNSTGRSAWIAAFGDHTVSSPHVLRCLDAPAGVPCYVLTSRQPAFVPNVSGSSGNLCLGGTGFGRFSNFVALTDPQGRYELQLDPAAIAQPNGTVAANVGETWYFQAWFRDSSGGTPTSNLSNGVALRFDG